MKLWGAYGYKPDADAFRVTVKPIALVDPVESFTIAFDNLKDDGATIVLEVGQDPRAGRTDDQHGGESEPGNRDRAEGSEIA